MFCDTQQKKFHSEKNTKKEEKRKKIDLVEKNKRVKDEKVTHLSSINKRTQV